LSEFNALGVEYLVVGAYALAAHGRVRATGDLDVWVRPDAQNAKRVVAALGAFGAPLHDVGEDDFGRAGLVFQIGVAPLRIDILTSIDAVDFGEAWHARSLPGSVISTFLCCPSLTSSATSARSAAPRTSLTPSG
jgi:hypothetical protein